MSSVSPPRVCVVMPRGGTEVHAPAYKAFLVPVNNCNLECDEQVIVLAGHAESQTSANNMQELWATVKNFRDDGACTHMAMIHSDIDAPMGWVNVLWNEARLNNLALISAVVAIKEPSGRTSTAVGSSTDPWRVKRFIRVQDRYRMPQTFTTDNIREDPDDVLLVNNGLMLLDLRGEWTDEYNFICPSVVEKDAASGKWRHRFRSEDWELSRLLHSRGIPYGATWAVRVAHLGNGRWLNDMEP